MEHRGRTTKNITSTCCSFVPPHVISHLALIVEQLPDVRDLSDVPSRTRADLVICGLDDPDLINTWHLLLRSHPQVGVLDLRKDGREAFPRELRLRRTVLGEAHAPLINVARSVVPR